ncbi:hypothetical protein COX69_03830 [Candidatus Falkowbacteria bacterium CG_4_10_14_0_2_um_filter_48_10]|nr:MAG: hypothetical protein COX69_03830 [Candidatus Falkowbacteria bacterium CG_4_10_14_0_2_um_filter_48_10]
MARSLARSAATGLLFFLKALVLVFGLIRLFLVLFIFRPLIFLERFFFRHFLVKFYCRYLEWLNRLGWQGFRHNSVFFIFSQKLIHIVVMLVCLSLAAANVFSRPAAIAYSGEQKTIIASLVESEFGSLEEEELVVEFFDQEEVISETQQKYLDNLSVLDGGPRQPGAEEAEDNQVLVVSENGESVIKPDIAATEKIKRPRQEIIEYVVQPGDTVSTIAQEFEISVNTILWENDLSAYSIIRPGDKLAILPMTGLTHKVAKNETLGKIANKYKISEEEIKTANNLQDEQTLAIGQKLIIPGGRKIITPRPTSLAGNASPTTGGIKPDAKTPVSGAKMNWPTVGKRITQYFSWRHYAIDIANKIGTPIYAAEAGTIEVAGWGTGYGNQILINHGNGKKTRYAHMSAFYAKAGDQVAKGEAIGAMGSTGWSTGPHLHFELIINGVKVNPLNYLQ